MEAAEGRRPLLLGVEAGEGPSIRWGGGEGGAVDHRPQLGQGHPLRGGGGEEVDVAGPGELPVGEASV